MDPDARPLVPWAALALIACAAVFIFVSSRQLPALVASHFDAAGRVNGHMTRGLYLAVMLLVSIVVPLLLVVIPSRALARPGARINLPNRDYWLAPERREETIRFLARQMAFFACLVLIFLCYVQWLVVRANALTPPMLDSRALFAGLAAFLVCTLSWIARLIGRFR